MRWQNLKNTGLSPEYPVPGQLIVTEQAQKNSAAHGEYNREPGIRKQLHQQVKKAKIGDSGKHSADQKS